MSQPLMKEGLFEGETRSRKAVIRTSLYELATAVSGEYGNFDDESVALIVSEILRKHQPDNGLRKTRRIRVE